MISDLKINFWFVIMVEIKTRIVMRLIVYNSESYSPACLSPTHSLAFSIQFTLQFTRLD